ncbi:hypothetical protein [Intestinibacter bartlettii]|uniref:Uncharacterized protein n=1 Tax=Intestinibacter bartlettii TaxID=261299 RepID=A0ABS8CUM9_9FIRM|nr:hypothetical protein [Intestinibacter bartlettii]MCB5396368.1 hypothetical protein [Intestinibacter bartlettii]MCB5402925.1 hypothetical protein [Intestinibacter bartlettii]MCB5445173.1 hypothetical protein [Intestinibacter bartlettii]MCB5719976.1 hypothetical protein [Intestinibacter bartlettii]MCB5747986.1 hypothetical protein [Intestinibacter bartlettii]
MTLIAAGKISDKEGFVVSDIRLTDGNIQSDSALKFTRIKNDEKELYIYIAGMISLLEEIEKEFSSGYLDLIKYDSIDQENEVFINLLNNIFQEYLKQEKDKSDLIVIYLDKSQDIFKLFKIEFYLENGECRYRIINNSNSIIIGSGSAICNGGSSEFILNIYNDAKKNGCDLTTAISAVIFNIKGKLEDLQSNVYCSTGISPVFHYAIIEGSTFELQELEIKGINLDKNKKINFFDYSIECNDDYDLIEFKDRINNNETKVEKIHKNVDYNTNKKFDPEKREE